MKVVGVCEHCNAVRTQCGKIYSSNAGSFKVDDLVILTPNGRLTKFREPGFYYVDGTIGYWNGDVWLFAGSLKPVNEDGVKAVGNKIPGV